MTLYYYLTRKYLEQFIKYATLNSPIFKENSKSARIGSACSALLVCLLVAGFPQNIFLALFAAALMFFLFPSFQKGEVASNTKKIAKYWNEADFNGGYQLSFFENCMVETRPRLRLELPYSSITQLALDWPLIYIFYQQQEAIVVPVEIFKSEADAEALLNFLCQKNPSLTKPVVRAPVRKIKNKMTK